MQQWSSASSGSKSISMQPRKYLAGGELFRGAARFLAVKLAEAKFFAVPRKISRKKRGNYFLPSKRFSAHNRVSSSGGTNQNDAKNKCATKCEINADCPGNEECRATEATCPEHGYDIKNGGTFMFIEQKEMKKL